MPGLQQLEHFVEQSALRHIGEQVLRLDQRRSGFGLEREAQTAKLRRKTHGTNDAHRVFPVPCGRVANHTQGAVFGILQAMVIIHHHLVQRVVVHGVDGEITPNRVLFLRAPDVVAQHTTGAVDRMLHPRQLTAAGLLVASDLLSGCVVEVGAKCGHLNHFVFAPPAKHHVHDAKAPPDDERTAKEPLHLFRCGVGCHIKVLGTQAHQQVAHRPPHHIGFKTGFLQRANHGHRALIDQ